VSELESGWKCLRNFDSRTSFRNNRESRKKKESDPGTFTFQMGLHWPDVSVGCSSFFAWLEESFSIMNPGRWLDSETLLGFLELARAGDWWAEQMVLLREGIPRLCWSELQPPHPWDTHSLARKLRGLRRSKKIDLIHTVAEPCPHVRASICFQSASSFPYWCVCVPTHLYALTSLHIYIWIYIYVFAHIWIHICIRT